MTTENYSSHYIRYCKTNNITPDIEFIKWINNIEKQINKKIGLKLLDLPDEPYMDMYEDLIIPEEVVDHILGDLSCELSLDLAF